MRTMKQRMTSLILCAAMALAVITGGMAGTVTASASDTSSDEQEMIVCLGADLTSEQRATVLDLLGLTESDLTDENVVYITNEDEHEYLDDYLSSDVIGSKALSSALVTKSGDGEGLSITTENISYCTISMYQSALVTAGAEDITVKIVGPTSISGTAGLVGVMKAYSQMTGDEVDEEALDAACDEITTTGDIAESTGDSEGTEELIAAVKQAVVENDLTDSEDIEEVINDAAEQIGLELSDEDVQTIITLMQKVAGLDLDADTIREQASDLYDKLTEKGYDLGVTKEAAMSLLDKLLAWVKSILSKLTS